MVQGAARLPRDGAEGRFASLTSVASAITGAYVYHYQGHRIEHCTLRGLDKPDHRRKHRDGILLITTTDGAIYELTVSVSHQQLIQEGPYVLIGCRSYAFWVVGRTRDTGHIEKVSVVMIPSLHQRNILQRMKLAPVMGSAFV